jgi:hypothetical protein
VSNKTCKDTSYLDNIPAPGCSSIVLLLYQPGDNDKYFGAQKGMEMRNLILDGKLGAPQFPPILSFNQHLDQSAICPIVLTGT